MESSLNFYCSIAVIVSSVSLPFGFFVALKKIIIWKKYSYYCFSLYFFYLHVCNSVNALICVYPNQVCADGSCHLIGNCPGGGNGTPTCNDWTTIQVNGCTKTMWNANPRASACLTSSVAVRLQLSNSAAKMAFANTSAGTTCSSISDANYSSPVAYSATPTWNLNHKSPTMKSVWSS